jgi:branched-chain amino acid transport system permease protein
LTVGGFDYWLHMGLFIFMYVAIASSWNIIGGYAGYISLGHNVFFAIGGYAGAILFAYFGVSPFVAAPLCGLIAMAVGFLVGMITLRVRGPTFIISTIALVLLTKILIDNWDYVGGTSGISLALLDLPVAVVKLPFYYYMLALAVGAVALSVRIRRSKFGLGLRAISQDETKAEVAGVPTRFYKILAFALSGLFIGMAGALWGYYSTYLSPAIYLSILVGAKFVLMTILGGRGTVSGPVVGAVVFIAANEYFVANYGDTELNIVAMGVLLVVVLMFFPEGIVGTLKKTGRLPRFLDWD